MDMQRNLPLIRRHINLNLLQNVVAKEGGIVDKVLDPSLLAYFRTS